VDGSQVFSAAAKGKLTKANNRVCYRYKATNLLWIPVALPQIKHKRKPEKEKTNKIGKVMYTENRTCVFVDRLLLTLFLRSYLHIRQDT